MGVERVGALVSFLTAAVGRFVLVEWYSGHGPVSAVAHQQLDAFLGIVEHLMTSPGKSDSLLVHFQGVFQAQVSGFELLDNVPQPLQCAVEARFFKLLYRRVAHRRMVWRGFRQGQR